MDSAVDKLRSRYGDDCLKRAIVMDFSDLTEKIGRGSENNSNSEEDQ